MKIVVFKGGLGNQLFQYAFYKYLSERMKPFISTMMLGIM